MPPSAPLNPSNQAALSSNTGVERVVNVEDEEDGQSGGGWTGDWPQSLNEAAGLGVQLQGSGGGQACSCRLQRVVMTQQ